jgi:hypothetical protein
MKDAAGGREITRPALTGYQDFVKITQSGMCGSHSGAEQWKCLQPVLEDYCISHKVGVCITSDTANAIYGNSVGLDVVVLSRVRL